MTTPPAASETPETDAAEFETDDCLKVITSDRARSLERRLREAEAFSKKLQEQKEHL